MYNIFVRYTCKNGKREELVERLDRQGIAEAIRGEVGCLKYDYYFSEKDSRELLLIESWEKKEDQQLHMSQPHMSILRDICAECVDSTEFGEFEIL